MLLRRLSALFPLLLLLSGFVADAAAKPTLLSGKNANPAISACQPTLPVDYVPIERRYRKGLIFRIDGCAGALPSYLLGTMHHDDPAFAHIIAEAERLIEETRASGFEYIEDPHSQQVALQYMLLPSTDSNGIRSLLTAQEYATLTQIITTRTPIPEQVINRLRPWAAALLMQYPKPKGDGIALDSRLQQYAISHGKTLFGLETPEQQYDIFANLPADMQLRMLKDGIREIDEIDKSNELLGQAYVARDLRNIHRLAQDSFANMKDQKLAFYMRQNLIQRRNVIMANGMLQRLPEGSQFTAVGALHLFGKGGVLDLLESKGYRISQAD